MEAGTESLDFVTSERLGHLVQSFWKEGFAIRPGIFPQSEIEGFIEQLGVFSGAGTRKMLDSSLTRKIVEDARLSHVVLALLSHEARPVRGILFDKTSAMNWRVPFHQDVTICVSERRNAIGFQNWSVKEGVDHVQPPDWILKRLIAVRIHLDDCPATNGALCAIPGSHLMGRLSDREIERTVRSGRRITIEANKGDVMFMHGLTIHSSSISERPGHRRVLHIEYCDAELPGGLEWRW